jgi:hypothetical protein
VLAAATLLAFFLRNPYPEVAFTQNVSQVDRVPGAGESVTSAFAAVQGDRAYLAYQQGRDLTVIAYDLAAKRHQWTETLRAPGSSSVTWQSVTAEPDGVLAVANQYTGDQPRTLFAVAWADRKQQWHYPLASDDDVLPTPKMLVVTDSRNHRLVGLDRHTGTEKWKLADKQDKYGSVSSATHPVLGSADLTAPTGLDGAPLGPLGDGRLVQLSADSSARVIDSATGTEVTSKGNRGDQRSWALATGGRLYLASGSSAYELTSYDLGSLEDPKTIYRSDQTHTLKGIAPCGKHICLLDVAGSDQKTAQVVAVDPGGGSKVAWHREAPGADLLTPLGGGVMAQDTGSSDRYAAVFGPGGEPLLSPADGKGKTGVRVTAGSALLFAGGLLTYPTDQSLYGFNLGKHTAVPLGQALKVRSASCAVNTKLLVCPADGEFTIWRFAS